MSDNNIPINTDRKRVVKNSIILGARLVIVMFVTFFTSRIVLEALGVVDYGVYNVVAGTTSAFAFFTYSLASSTQRFLNFEMGKGDGDSLKRYFSMSFWLYLFLGAGVFVIGSFFGPWLVYDVLIIPAESQVGALVVYYFALLNLALAIPLSVFESAIIAHENMKVYSYLSIIEVILKLAIAYSVMFLPHKLIIYGIVFVVGSFIIPRTILVIYAMKHYIECRPTRIWNWKIGKELLNFGGWESYGGLIYIINDEGLNVVLNIFFGPVVNAARGISMQVYTAVFNFLSGFTTAVRPQIVKTFATENFTEVRNLFSFATRTSFYIVFTFSIPIILRVGQVLNIWLTEVPGYGYIFVQLALLYCMICSLWIPVISVAHAIGNMRRYNLWCATTFLLAFPLSILLITLGAEPWIIFPCLILTRGLSIIAAILAIRKHFIIPFHWYFFKVLGRIAGVVLLSSALSWFLNKIYNDNFGGLVLFGAMSVLSTALIIYLLGLTHSERKGIDNKISSFIGKLRHH